MTKKKDISVTPAKDRKILAEDAKAIRKLGKSTIKNLIEIGRRLTRDKELVGHGNWGQWLAREFKGWSESTALKYMQSYKFSVEYKADKSITVTDLNIGVRALFSLAAPSTTKEARHEVITRVKAGEKMTPAKVKTVVQKTKKPKAGKKPEPQAPERATDAKPGANGNGVDPQASANERKAGYEAEEATGEAGEAAGESNSEPAPKATAQTKATAKALENSARQLKEFKVACDIRLPKLSKDDRAEAVRYANEVMVKFKPVDVPETPLVPETPPTPKPAQPEEPAAA
jgi:hypothetical protein